MIGAAPAEANDETWGLGIQDGHRRSSATRPNRLDARAGPARLPPEGAQRFSSTPEAFQYRKPSPLAARSRRVKRVLAGTIPAAKSGEHEQQVLLVRNPGGHPGDPALPAEGKWR